MKVSKVETSDETTVETLETNETSSRSEVPDFLLGDASNPDKSDNTKSHVNSVGVFLAKPYLRPLAIFHIRDI